MSELRYLLQTGNERFLASPLADGDRLPKKPRLGMLLLTCMDTRIDPFSIFGLTPGEIHVIRNAGGIVDDSAIRSLLLSQRTLGTTKIVVMQHFGCKAIDVPADATLETIAPLGEIPFADLPDGNPVAGVTRALQQLRTVPGLDTREMLGFTLDIHTLAISPVD